MVSGGISFRDVWRRLKFQRRKFKSVGSGVVRSYVDDGVWPGPTDKHQIVGMCYNHTSPFHCRHPTAMSRNTTCRRGGHRRHHQLSSPSSTPRLNQTHANLDPSPDHHRLVRVEPRQQQLNNRPTRKLGTQTRTAKETWLLTECGRHQRLSHSRHGVLTVSASGPCREPAVTPCRSPAYTKRPDSRWSRVNLAVGHATPCHLEAAGGILPYRSFWGLTARYLPWNHCRYLNRPSRQNSRHMDKNNRRQPTSTSAPTFVPLHPRYNTSNLIVLRPLLRARGRCNMNHHSSLPHLTYAVPQRATASSALFVLSRPSSGAMHTHTHTLLHA